MKLDLNEWPREFSIIDKGFLVYSYDQIFAMLSPNVKKNYDRKFLRLFEQSWAAFSLAWEVRRDFFCSYLKRIHKFKLESNMKADNSTFHSEISFQTLKISIRKCYIKQDSWVLNPFLNVFGSVFAQNNQLLSKLVMSLYFEQDINSIAPPGNKRWTTFWA